jgi:hypothetical protein
MEVVKIVVGFSDCGFPELTYTAVEEGIKINLVDGHERYETLIPYTLVEDNRSLVATRCNEFGTDLIKLKGSDIMTFTLYASDDKQIFWGEMDFDQVKKRYSNWIEKYIEMVDEDIMEDEQCIVMTHHFENIFESFIYRMINHSKTLQKHKLVSDTSCPVLHTPLTGKNAYVLTTCNHFISKEAWSKISMKEEGGDCIKLCPLCRCKYTNFRGVE